MRNKTVISFVNVISKLVKTDPKEFVKDNLLLSIESKEIVTYRANYNVKLLGRKWLAPLYRPLVSLFNIKKGSFITVRHNNRSCDIEFADGSENITITMKKQDWAEKSPYFLLIPANRFRGSLSQTVKQIREYRRCQNARKN